MKRSLIQKCIFACLIVICISSMTAAGQLHVKWYGLSDVAKNGLAVIGTVISISLTNNTLRFKVNKIFNRTGQEPHYWAQRKMVGRKSDVFFKKGETYTESYKVNIVETQEVEIEIYQGVVWDNPNKSPIDRRLSGYQQLTALRKGQEVVVVFSGKEVLTADSATLRKLNLFYNNDTIKVNDRVLFSIGESSPQFPEKAKSNSIRTYEYGASESLSQLKKDLLDFDLKEMAKEALKSRNQLTAKLLLSIASEEGGHWNVFSEHYSSLSMDEKRDFMSKAIKQQRIQPNENEIVVLMKCMANYASDEIPVKEKGAALSLWLNYVYSKNTTEKIPSSYKNFFPFLPTPLKIQWKDTFDR